MRIIEVGDKAKETITTCQVCGSVIAYTDGDVVKDICPYIQCPVCSSFISPALAPD